MSGAFPSGSEAAAPPLLRITNREDLAFALTDASTLEHMIMCEYLFAAFSLRQDEGEGLDSEQANLVRKWEGVITKVAVQEMTHLALVNNMLVSIGCSPYFYHGSFPQPSRYFSPNVRLALIPFSEQALRHFLYLERPEGMSIAGVPGFEVLGDLDPEELKGGIVPKGQYFTTVGNLYRGIEKGLRDLVEKMGEDGVFIGAGNAQATEDRFGLPSLFQVRDLESATKAVEGIVEMGEGARGKWEGAHFGMFVQVFKEHAEAKKRDPDFRPTKPVVAAFVRPPVGDEEVPLITDTFTSRVSDLFNASYSLAIGTLSRFYVHQAEYSDELQRLADAAVGLMTSVVKPLGNTLTTLPVGARLPGLTAGPTFELQRTGHLLPHREQAFMVLQERFIELADYAGTLSKEAPSQPHSARLESVRRSLLDLSQELKLDLPA